MDKATRERLESEGWIVEETDLPDRVLHEPGKAQDSTVPPSAKARGDEGPAGDVKQGEAAAGG